MDIPMNDILSLPLPESQVETLDVSISFPEDEIPELESTYPVNLAIPTINIQVYEPEGDTPVSPVIIEEREIEFEVKRLQHEVYNSSFLSPAYFIPGTPVLFRNYSIKDSDGIRDTYLQPFKIDETEDGGDLWCRGNTSMSSDQVKNIFIISR